MRKAKGKKEGWKSNFEQYRGMGKNNPYGALVKSQGIERYGKDYAKSWSGKDNGDECE
jgi:hypothetical protein